METEVIDSTHTRIYCCAVESSCFPIFRYHRYFICFVYNNISPWINTILSSCAALVERAFIERYRVNSRCRIFLRNGAHAEELDGFEKSILNKSIWIYMYMELIYIHINIYTYIYILLIIFQIGRFGEDFLD